MTLIDVVINNPVIPASDDSNTSFWLSSASNAIGSIIGVAGSVLILLWTFRRDKKKTLKEKVEKQHENNVYMTTLIRSCLENVGIVINNLDAVIKERQSKPESYPVLVNVNLDNFRRISSELNLESYLNSYLQVDLNMTKDQQIRSFQKTINCIDFFNLAFNSLYIDYRERELYVIEAKRTFKECVDQTQKEILRVGAIKQPDYGQVRLIHAKLVSDYKDMYDMNYLVNNMFFPLQDYLKKTSRFDTDDLHTLSILSTQGIKQYEHIMHENLRTTVDLQKRKLQFEEGLSGLRKLTAEFLAFLDKDV